SSDEVAARTGRYARHVMHPGSMGQQVQRAYDIVVLETAGDHVDTREFRRKFRKRRSEAGKLRIPAECRLAAQSRSGCVVLQTAAHRPAAGQTLEPRNVLGPALEHHYRLRGLQHVGEHLCSGEVGVPGVLELVTADSLS